MVPPESVAVGFWNTKSAAVGQYAFDGVVAMTLVLFPRVLGSNYRGSFLYFYTSVFRPVKTKSHLLLPSHSLKKYPEIFLHQHVRLYVTEMM